MYFKNYVTLFTVNLLVAVAMMLSINYFGNKEFVFAATEDSDSIKTEKTSVVNLKRYDSYQREIDFDIIKPAYCIEVNEEDIEILMKIVESEAGCENREGKLLIANVVINRVKDKRFPDNVKDVVYQRKQNVTQFSPVSNGRINKVKISDETKDVIYSALMGEDISKGALYFMARQFANADNVKWFDNNLKFLFAYGGHEFYQ
ncbi:MAG: cell wall hydrolase [Lachnospiraceae bacterium]|nr:cell wall hydrolase [Lachnospiraceae bacterium]MEE0919557.1 cell wall hydrolase [Lachnospiraceae bacterium]